MISVVVPTMWRYSPFADFFLRVLNHPLVSDAVLINNHRQHTPNHDCVSHPKLQILDCGQNLFVNPSWNLGVYHSKSKLVCIMNDDIVFDTRLFGRIVKWYQPSFGCVGLAGGLPVDGDIWFQQHTDQSCFGFGQLMFVHQHNWIDIPHDLLVYFGDNWIFDSHKSRGYSNYLIRNLLNVTPHAQTSSEQGHRLDQERQIYTNLLLKYGLPCSHG